MDPSSYEVPNSPIASSKRPRAQHSVSKKALKYDSEVKSPNATRANRKEDETGLAYDDESIARTISTRLPSEGGAADGTDPATFPGILFSPTLKKDEQIIHVQEEELEEEDNIEVFNPYLFIAGLPPHITVADKKKVCLPPKISSRPHTLVLDLDETLVHCTVEPIEQPDLVFPVTFNGSFYQVYVRKRPHLDHFLESVAKNFEVVVFTASQRIYADALLDFIDPKRKLISHRLFREACVFVQGNYIKDLTVLGRDLASAVLVDNSPHAYGFQIDNGIPIESWFEDSEDKELLALEEFLSQLLCSDDVRPLVRNKFKTHELVDLAKAADRRRIAATNEY